MRIAVAADELVGVAAELPEELRRRGHEPIVHGALSESERSDWAWASEAAARDVTSGVAQQAIVACWTGTGASIAANKVAGVRAALCGDAQTAAGARRWNDANVLALSLRLTSRPALEEILDAWFEAQPSADRVTREAYSHEVSSCGFWPGGDGIEEPAFYSYAFPEPTDFAASPVRPGAAFYSRELGQFILPYEAVRLSDAPDAMLMDFVQSTYEAAANLGRWDRAGLERPSG